MTFPILISGYLTKNISESYLLKEKEKKLFGAAQMLDHYLAEDFDRILQEKNVLMADKETKIKILNETLSEYTDTVARAYPGIGVGYYVKDLHAIVTYGPSSEHGHIVGRDISSSHPGNFVMKSGEKEVEVGHQVRGPIMNAMLPIKRNGEVLGYVWANERMVDVEKQLAEMDRILYLILGLGTGIAILLLLIFWNKVLDDIYLVKQGLKKMNFNLKERIVGTHGEIGEIAEEVNEMAASLLHARSLSENVMDNMMDGVITVDQSGKITFMNQAAMSLTGVTLEQVIGKSYYDSMFHDIKMNHTRLLSDTLKTGRNHIGVEMDYPINGKNLYIIASTSLLHDSDGKIIGAILTFKDISEKRHLEQQVYRADRLAALGEMMAGVAHEIRNPLTAIKSMVQYLHEGSTEEERQEFEPMIVREVDRVNKIIEELLYFARPSTANIIPVHVNQLIEQTVTLAKNASKKKISYRLNLDQTINCVEMDPEQFKQVFLNILINSAQAMDYSGEITVESSFDDEHDGVILHFSDTGPGLEEEIIEKVLDPFYTTKREGTGIGLAVVNRILIEHNGDILIKNIPSGGLRVTLQIPLFHSKKEVSL